MAANVFYSIYVLKQPASDTVRYVGMSCDIDKRFSEHLKENRPSHRVNWIRSVLATGQVPEIEIIEDNLLLHQAFKKEVFYIKLFKSFGAVLTNSTIGGEAPMANKKHTTATKELMSENRKGKNNSFYGKKHSKETLKKLSAALMGRKVWSKGKKFSPEHKAAMSAAKLGKHPSNYGKTRFDLENIRLLHKQGKKQSEIARIYKTDQGTISGIINFINYK